MKKTLFIIFASFLLALNCNAQTAEPLEKPQLSEQASDANKQAQNPVSGAVEAKSSSATKASDTQERKPADIKENSQNKDSFFKPANILTIIFGSMALIVSIGSLWLSNKSNRDQNRAYVHASEAKFIIDPLGLRISLEATNTGHTPAKWWETACKCGVYEPSETSKLIDFVDFRDISEFSRWPALASGHSLTAGVGSKKDQEFILKTKSAGKYCFYIYGVIRYKTIFNEIFETQFVFYHPMPERGRKLSRPNMHIEAYKPIKHSV